MLLKMRTVSMLYIKYAIKMRTESMLLMKYAISNENRKYAINMHIWAPIISSCLLMCKLHSEYTMLLMM